MTGNPQVTNQAFLAQVGKLVKQGWLQIGRRRSMKMQHIESVDAKSLKAASDAGIDRARRPIAE